MANTKGKIEKSPHATHSTPATQKYLPMAEIHEGVVVMQDGTLRAVLLVSSMNFSLKSEEEQNATIQGYMQFLNSIEFPLEIVIQSRNLDIDNYLSSLEKKEKEQTNDLLRLQISDYRQFISEMVELSDITSKKFFIVVPYDPVSDKKNGFWPQVKALISTNRALALSHQEFEDRKHLLEQRVSNVMNGLSSMGLNAVRLETQSLIELYYNTYNPDVATREKMVDVSKIQVES
ncbi:MAG: hypothetical protein Q8P11_00285 [bacterium]|nr:hypothetical protein [bacterium]